jgi:hypothetical protein
MRCKALHCAASCFPSTEISQIHFGFVLHFQYELIRSAALRRARARLER